MMELHLPTWSEIEPLLPGAGVGLAVLLVGAAIMRFVRVGPGAVIVGLAPFAAHAFTWRAFRDWPEWPPIQGSEKMLVAALGVSVIGIVAFLARRHDRWARLLQVGAIAALVWWLLGRFVGDPNSAIAIGSFDFCALIAAPVFFWFVLEELGERVKGPVVPLTLALMAGVVAQLFVEFHASAFLTQLVATLSLWLGAYSLFAAFLGNNGFPVVLAAGVTAIATGIGYDVYFLGPTLAFDPRVFGLVAVTPLLLFFSALPRIREWKPAVRVPLQMLLVVGLLGFALWWAMDQRPVSEEPSGQSIEDLYEEYR